MSANATPAVKDLPKIDQTLAGQIATEHKLKNVEVTEKNVLPSAEDLKQEKTHQGLLKGVEEFTPEKLNQVKTREPASGADVVKVEMAHDNTLKEVKDYDTNKLKDVKTVEKNTLPDTEAIKAEAEHIKFNAGIQEFDKDKLRHSQTIEKNTLPTKEIIEQEKKA